MGIVAPITGVIAAVIPVVAGIVLEGLPTPLVMFGIGLAFVAVVLVSRVADDRAGPSGVGLALLAGVAIGAVGVAISQISDGHVFGPLTVLRATEALLIGAIVLVGKRAWRPNLRLWPALAGVGILDMAGNGGSSWPSRPARWPSPPSSRRSTRSRPSFWPASSCESGSPGRTEPGSRLRSPRSPASRPGRRSRGRTATPVSNAESRWGGGRSEAHPARADRAG